MGYSKSVNILIVDAIVHEHFFSWTDWLGDGKQCLVSSEGVLGVRATGGVVDLIAMYKSVLPQPKFKTSYQLNRAQHHEGGIWIPSLHTDC